MGGGDGAHLSTIVDRYATPVVKEKNENEVKTFGNMTKQTTPLQEFIKSEEDHHLFHTMSMIVQCRYTVSRMKGLQP